MDNSYAIESFIEYCDGMMIATEGVKEGFEKVKAWLIKQFTKLINAIHGWVRKKQLKHNIKDTINNKMGGSALAHAYDALDGLLVRCKAGLAKSKALNNQNPELAEQLKQEVEFCSKIYKEQLKILNGNIEAGQDIVSGSGYKYNDKEMSKLKRNQKRIQKRDDKLKKSMESYMIY